MKKIPENYEERKWLDEHFYEVASKYKGKVVAIHKKGIIASAENIDGLNKILTSDFQQIKPFVVAFPEKIDYYPQGEKI
ncbi:MAG: DUF5678 domain-containing protein [bacterium]|nr:DUF5678 domain-containing protein [bacterium]